MQINKRLNKNLRTSILYENCKGSNVGFAIAFVLFISFIIFILSIVNFKGKIGEDKDFLINHLEKKIKEVTSDDVTIISTKENPNLDCTVIESLNLKNFVLKTSGPLIKIYSSPEFSSNFFGCNPPQGYEIGLIKKENYVFESKILNLIGNYDTDYSQLKKDFGIPNTNEFYFNFIRDDKTITKPSKNIQIPETDVYAKDIPITYIDSYANIKVGYFRIMVW